MGRGRSNLGSRPSGGAVTAPWEGQPARDQAGRGATIQGAGVAVRHRPKRFREPRSLVVRVTRPAQEGLEPLQAENRPHQGDRRGATGPEVTLVRTKSESTHLPRCEWRSREEPVNRNECSHAMRPVHDPRRPGWLALDRARSRSRVPRAHRSMSTTSAVLPAPLAGTSEPLVLARGGSRPAARHRAARVPPGYDPLLNHVGLSSSQVLIITL